MKEVLLSIVVSSFLLFGCASLSEVKRLNQKIETLENKYVEKEKEVTEMKKSLEETKRVTVNGLTILSNILGELISVYNRHIDELHGGKRKEGSSEVKKLPEITF